MKKITSLLLTLIAALAVLGCRTVTDSSGNSVRVIDTNLVDRAAFVLQASVSATVAIASAKDANAANYFRLSADVLSKAISGTNTSPAALRSDIAKIPVNELHGQWAELAVAGAIGLYDVFLQQHVKDKVGHNYAAVTLLAAVRDGLRSGIGDAKAKAYTYAMVADKLNGFWPRLEL
jgi:hypothetical protein